MSAQNTSSQQAAFLHITEAPQGHFHNMLRSFPNILCAPHKRESGDQLEI